MLMIHYNYLSSNIFLKNVITFLISTLYQLLLHLMLPHHHMLTASFEAQSYGCRDDYINLSLVVINQ